MKFECSVQIGDGPDAKVQEFGSFVKNFIIMHRGLLVAANATIVDVTGTSKVVGAGERWPQHCNYYNYYNYSAYDSWG
jgi:hypothetical protein